MRNPLVKYRCSKSKKTGVEEMERSENDMLKKGKCAVPSYT